MLSYLESDFKYQQWFNILDIVLDLELLNCLCLQWHVYYSLGGCLILSTFVFLWGVKETILYLSNTCLKH